MKQQTCQILHSSWTSFVVFEKLACDSVGLAGREPSGAECCAGAVGEHFDDKKTDTSEACDAAMVETTMNLMGLTTITLMTTGGQSVCY